MAMLIVGLVMMNGGLTSHSSGFPSEISQAFPDTGMAPTPHLPSAPFAFQMLWVIACLSGLAMSVFNLVSESGLPAEVIEENFVPTSGDFQTTSNSAPADSATLLKELETLRRENLVSESEYQSRREKILSRFA
jgi:hypothetical protein